MRIIWEPIYKYLTQSLVFNVSVVALSSPPAPPSSPSPTTQSQRQRGQIQPKLLSQHWWWILSMHIFNYVLLYILIKPVRKVFKDNKSLFCNYITNLCFLYSWIHNHIDTYLKRYNSSPWNEHCCSVTQSCPTFLDPMDCSTPGFTVLNYLPELAQTRVHLVSDAIQSSHLLSSPSPHAFNLSQHQGLF